MEYWRRGGGNHLAGAWGLLGRYLLIGRWTTGISIHSFCAINCMHCFGDEGMR